MKHYLLMDNYFILDACVCYKMNLIAQGKISPATNINSYTYQYLQTYYNMCKQIGIKRKK